MQMGDEKYLRCYTKLYELDYPGSIGEIDLEILNSDTFHSIKRTKFNIDMSDIEKEKNEVFLYDVDNDDTNIPNKEKVCLLNIKYTNEEFLSYSLLCSLIEQKVYSFEGYIISTIAILANSSYYSAWVYRRKCLKYLSINLLNELKFTRCIISNNVKSFQSWFHRRWLVEYIFRWNKAEEMKGIHSKHDWKQGNINFKDINFNDPSTFLSSDEDEIEEKENNENRNFCETTNDIVFNCKENYFHIEKKSVVLNDDLKHIVEKYDFFKASLLQNEKVDMNKLLYEEILYNNCDIFMDTKNYNSWAYKCWIMEHFGILKNNEFCKEYNIVLNEFQLMNRFLKTDIYNNSVWIYRYFIFNKMHYINDEEKLQKEILFCLSYAKKFFDNEAIFNYFMNIVFQYLNRRKQKRKLKQEKEKFHMKMEVEMDSQKEKTTVDDTSNEHIFDIPIIKQIHQDLRSLRTKSKFALLFLAQLYSYNKLHNKEIECYKYLERHDNFNDQIWKQLIEETNQKEDNF